MYKRGESLEIKNDTSKITRVLHLIKTEQKAQKKRLWKLNREKPS